MRIIVVGCGRVGSQLGTMLAVEGHDVVVIDKNEDAFRRLGSEFNGVTIKGLGFDEEVLEEAGVREADVLAAVTDLDNTNVMAAEVARKIFGVPHAVARLYNPARERTYQQLGLDYVSGTSLIAQVLMDKIESGHGHHVTTIGDVELIEFKGGPDIDGKRVEEIEIAHRFRVATVARDKTTFIPAGETVLKYGDVLLCSVKEDAFGKVERFMEE